MVFRLFFLLAFAAAFSACGGGSGVGSGAVPNPARPGSTTTSNASMAFRDLCRCCESTCRRHVYQRIERQGAKPKPRSTRGYYYFGGGTFFLKRLGYCCLTYGLLFALVACGPGSTPIVVPAASPSSAPPSVLTVSPNPINVTGTGPSSTTSISVQQTGYSGAFTESDTCSGIATISPPSSSNGPTATYTAVGVAAGTCSASFTDTLGQKASTSVVVTTGGISISSAPLPHIRKDR